MDQKDGARESVRALLYTGNAENPNFHMPASLEEAAHIAAWSKGPSGENKAYVLEGACLYITQPASSTW